VVFPVEANTNQQQGSHHLMHPDLLLKDLHTTATSSGANAFMAFAAAAAAAAR
jgi:hypothetical protein